MTREIVSIVNKHPSLDIRALIISIQANKFTQYMHTFQALLAHHQRALQVLQNDRLVHWCLVCRTAKNSSMQNIHWIEYARAQAVRRINLTNSLCTCSVQRM